MDNIETANEEDFPDLELVSALPDVLAATHTDAQHYTEQALQLFKRFMERTGVRLTPYQLVYQSIIIGMGMEGRFGAPGTFPVMIPEHIRPDPDPDPAPSAVH